MITLPELLKDPQYREFFLKVPKFYTHAKVRPRFRLYVQLQGDPRWRVKEFPKYSEAFSELKGLLKAGKVHDAAICCKSHPTDPPMRNVRIKGKYRIDSRGKRVQLSKRIVWQPRLDVNDPDYQRWCPYCRRPTAFKYFARHHALNHLNPGLGVDPEVRRCVICGTSERLLDGRSR